MGSQVRILSSRPFKGALAQLGERLPCTQEVSGSIPLGSIILWCLDSNPTIALYFIFVNSLLKLGEVVNALVCDFIHMFVLTRYLTNYWTLSSVG